MAVVALLLTASPVPAADASYFDSVQAARERFASLGARFEIVIASFGVVASTLVLTDGYGEIYASWTGAERSSWPDAKELTEWLYYVGSQCPECSPGEPAWRESIG